MNGIILERHNRPRKPPLVTTLSPVLSASSMAVHFFWRRCWEGISKK